MKRIKLLCIIALLILGTGYSWRPAEAETLSKVPQSICGDWVVKKVITFMAAPVYEYIGLNVEYSSKRMRFGDKLVIKNPVYVSKKMSSEKFSEGYRNFVLSDIGIKENSVRVIDVFDNKEGARSEDFMGPGTTVFVRSKDRIIIDWNGAFYLLIRKGKACSGVPSQ